MSTRVKSSDRNSTRRAFLRKGAEVVSAVCVFPIVSHAAESSQSCIQPASQPLLQSLNYQAVSPDPAKACKGCAFFSADTTSASCGKCMIASGPVDATGHCDSWAARP